MAANGQNADEPNVADIVSGGAGLVTAVIALLVYMEARRIRQVEWLNRSVAMWQGFNQILLTVPEQGSARWRGILDGSIDLTEDCMPQDRYILYSYVNLLYFEYNLAKRGLIDKNYAVQSILRNLKQLVPNRAFIGPDLRGTGFDSEFVDYLDYFVGQDLDPEVVDRLASRLGDGSMSRWRRRLRLPGRAKASGR